MKKNRPKDNLPEIAGIFRGREISYSDPSIERSQQSNGSPDRKKLSLENNHQEGETEKIKGEGSVRKVKVDKLKMRQAESDTVLPLRRSPLKFGSPAREEGNRTGKPSFFRKIINCLSPSRKRSSSQEKYRVMENDFSSQENVNEPSADAGLVPKIKVIAEQNEFIEPIQNFMGNSIDENPLRGNVYRREANYETAFIKPKDGNQEIPTFSPKKRLLFKTQRSNIKFTETPHIPEMEAPMQMHLEIRTQGQAQADDKSEKKQFHKELSSEYPGINKILPKTVSKQYSRANTKDSEHFSFNYHVEDHPLAINFVPNLNSPKLLFKENNSPEFQNGKRSLSPTPFVRNNVVRLRTFKRAPSPEDLKFLATDKDTGVRYDTREMDNLDPKTQEIIDKLRRKKDLMWREWWDMKKENTQKFLTAVKENNTLEAEKYLSNDLGDMRVEPDCRDEKQHASLHYAAMLGNHRMVLLLLKNDAFVDITTPSEATPLILAAQKGFDNIITLLLEKGGDINHQDKFKNTPMHYAIIFNQLNVVRVLLARPSLDLTLKNMEEKTAFEYPISPEIKEEINNLSKKKRESLGSIKVPIIEAPGKRRGSKLEPEEASKMDEYDEDERKRSTLAHSGKELKVSPKDFTVLRLLGKGSFGNVFLVKKKCGSEQFAMKVLNKERIFSYNLIRYAHTEKRILCTIDHPYIVKLSYAFQTQDNLYLLLTYCPNGDLGKHLLKEKKFCEDRAKIYTAEVLLALEELHKHDIIYRDLKPDNVVLDEEGHALITDFGLSKEHVTDALQGGKSFCGSVAYLAPEMLKKAGHGKAVDWYLLGVFFYEMVTGAPPYYAATRDQIFNNIQKNTLTLPSSISEDAKSFLKSILKKDPYSRLGSGPTGSDEIKSHPLFKDINWADLQKRKIKAPYFNKISESLQKQSSVITLEDFVESDPSSEFHLQNWSFVKT